MEREGKGSSSLSQPLVDSYSSSSSPSSSSAVPEGRGSATSFQTLGNIVVSVVGTGVLGLPFAFRIAGWLAGSLGVAITGLATYYCMIILVQCRDRMASEAEQVEMKTYGDLGNRCFGKTGRCLTELLILVAQSGGSVAYLIFIGQNLSSIFRSHGLSFASFIFLLVPLEIVLSWINTLSALAPFSIFANICNVIAMGLVVKEDIQQAISGEFSFTDRKAISSNIGGLPFAGGMAVFCFEGFGMTLALEESMKERKRFPKLLGQAFSGITLLYILFGFFGYMAYGDQTRDIVTLNLPQYWTATAVQIGLCLGLSFTFPIMVHPINEILEDMLKRRWWFQKLCPADCDGSKSKMAILIVYIIRATVVIGLAVLATSVPGFGIFASLVGSTVCALLSFVLPATFHLRMLGSSLQLWQKALDISLLLCGLLFAVYGTYNTIAGV